jgi:hypothetical protein
MKTRMIHLPYERVAGKAAVSDSPSLEPEAPLSEVSRIKYTEEYKRYSSYMIYMKLRPRPRSTIRPMAAVFAYFPRRTFARHFIPS